MITLLHKINDLDKEDLNNCRPVALANTDYKILSKLLAERPSGVIAKLVGEDQVGCINGRNIGTIVMTIDNVIDYLNRTKQVGYILAVHGKHLILYQNNFYCMFSERLGSVQTLKWVSVLTKGTASCINHGGWVFESLKCYVVSDRGAPFHLWHLFWQRIYWQSKLETVQ